MHACFIYFSHVNEFSAAKYLTAVVGSAVLAEHTVSRCRQDGMYLYETVLSDWQCFNGKTWVQSQICL